MSAPWFLCLKHPHCHYSCFSTLPRPPQFALSDGTCSSNGLRFLIALLGIPKPTTHHPLPVFSCVLASWPSCLTITLLCWIQRNSTFPVALYPDGYRKSTRSNSILLVGGTEMGYAGVHRQYELRLAAAVSHHCAVLHTADATNSDERGHLSLVVRIACALVRYVNTHENCVFREP